MISLVFDTKDAHEGCSAFSEKRFPMVSFFDSSVAGLQIGAPVTFSGVQVGQVKSMGVRVNPVTGRTIIQVNMTSCPTWSPCTARRCPQATSWLRSSIKA